MPNWKRTKVKNTSVSNVNTADRPVEILVEMDGDGNMRRKWYKLDERYYPVNDVDFQGWFRVHGNEYDYNAEECIRGFVEFAKIEPRTLCEFAIERHTD